MSEVQGLQGYLAHKKQQPPRTLQKDYAQGHMVALRWGAVSYERGTPVLKQRPLIENISLGFHVNGFKNRLWVKVR